MNKSYDHHQVRRGNLSGPNTAAKRPTANGRVNTVRYDARSALVIPGTVVGE